MMNSKKKTCFLAAALSICLSSALPSQEPAPLSSFTTPLDGQEDGVRRNIALAAKKLQGIVIAPGAAFSFNDTVGEGSARGGYVDGRVLYREGAALEPGGGICQVSTTAFNAFLRAGFEIVTRHRHSQPVAYAPPGLDATIRYGKKDLVMKNPWPFPVTVLAGIAGESLTVSLRAQNALPFQYTIETEEEETVLPMGDDGREVRNGISAHVYRLKHRDGKVVEKRLLYRDYYPPAYIK
jgi:vancomycin resistance protein YoaR